MRVTTLGTFAVTFLVMEAPFASSQEFAAGVAQAQEAIAVDSLETRVWLDRGDEPVVELGDEIRIYYRTSADAYAAIFRIDTDGTVSLIFPQHPDADSFVGGERDYRLVLRDAPRWRVDDDPGVGYFFMVASDSPPDLSQFGFDAVDGWDLSGVGEAVYEDPYIAIDEYVATILPDWDIVPYALDFLTYNVGEDNDFPRFLCYDCHCFQSYSNWNPYAYSCSSYQVVIWDDPYFYPRYRYSGTRVVVARPPIPRPRYGMTARVAGSWGQPIVRTRQAPPRRTATYKAQTRSPRVSPTSVRRPSRTSRGKTVVPNRARSETSRPTLRRRDPSTRPPSSRARGSEQVRPPAISRRPATTRRPPVVRPPTTQRPGATRSPVRAPATGSRPRPTPTTGRSAPPPRRPAVRSGARGSTRGRAGPPPRRRGRGG